MGLVGSDAPFDPGRRQIEVVAGLNVTAKTVERTAEFRAHLQPILLFHAKHAPQAQLFAGLSGVTVIVVKRRAGLGTLPWKCPSR